jgi:hypothetical protein
VVNCHCVKLSDKAARFERLHAHRATCSPVLLSLSRDCLHSNPQLLLFRNPKYPSMSFIPRRLGTKLLSPKGF